MSVPQLCRCGHLSSSHESLGDWPTNAGTPCTECLATPNRQPGGEAAHMMCTGFREWPIDSMPMPGTIDAIEIGCRCPVRVNRDRAAQRLSPIYDPGCVVHEWVCKRDVCPHFDEAAFTAKDSWIERRHVGQHPTCEHCTVPNIACVRCSGVWFDWRVTPERAGWQLSVHKSRSMGPSRITPIPILWLCATCKEGDPQS